MSEHTPGPWEAHDDDGTGTLPCVLSGKVNAGGNFYVAQCNVYADAEFIVRAANSHDALLEALELAIEEHPSCIHPACPTKEVGAWCCFIGLARLAKGKN